MGIIDFLLALMQDMILSAIPAVGFAMVFNVPHRALPWCALLGALGHGSRMLMMSAGFNVEWSTFMASLLVGSIGIQWSRWYLAHPKVFTVKRGELFKINLQLIQDNQKRHNGELFKIKSAVA